MNNQSKNALRSVENEKMGEPAEILRFKDGDDDGTGEELQQFTIDVVTNGFVLTTCYDGDEFKEVHHDIDDVFKAIKGRL